MATYAPRYSPGMLYRRSSTFFTPFNNFWHQCLCKAPASQKVQDMCIMPFPCNLTCHNMSFINSASLPSKGASESQVCKLAFCMCQPNLDQDLSRNIPGATCVEVCQGDAPMINSAMAMQCKCAKPVLGHCSSCSGTLHHFQLASNCYC